MRQPLIIIGLGPRGLGLILRAIQSGIKVVGIDPFPLSTWTPPNIIKDMYMRSPITFDLVTFQKDLQEFSLANYLDEEINIDKLNQREVESNITIVHRTDFNNYLKEIWGYIKPRIEYIPEKAISISNRTVTLSNNEVIDGSIVVASGNNSKLNVPIWNRRYISEGKSSNYKRFLDKKVSTKNHIAVIGSGQNAAEVAYDFKKRGYKVTILTKHKSKVDKYPLPTYKDLGVRTALGDYYRRLPLKDKVNYLKDIKKWQPSITPYIDSKLKEFKVNKFTLTGTRDLNRLTPIDYYILCAGFKPNINNVPLEINEDTYELLPNFPILNKGFISNKGIYYTGLLATGYDGPRQGSLISIGETSEEIINHYKENG